MFFSSIENTLSTYQPNPRLVPNTKAGKYSTPSTLLKLISQIFLNKCVDCNCSVFIIISKCEFKNVHI